MGESPNLTNSIAAAAVTPTPMEASVMEQRNFTAKSSTSFAQGLGNYPFWLEWAFAIRDEKSS